MQTSGTYPSLPCRRKTRWATLIAALIAAGCPQWPARAETNRTIQLSEQRILADGLFARGLYELAEREYQALLSSPSLSNRVEVLFRLGECRRQTGRKEKAVGSFVEALGSARDERLRARIASRLAWTLVELDRPREALDYLRPLLVLSNIAPREAALLRFYAAEAFLRLDQPTSAGRLLEEIVKNFADSPVAPAAALYLDDLAADGRYTIAREPLLRLAETSTNSTPQIAAEALFRQGEIAFNAGRYRESRRIFSDLRRRFPQSDASRAAALPLGWSLYHCGDMETAVTLADIAIPDETNLARRSEWLYLKAVSLRTQHPDKAAAALRELLSCCPHSDFAPAARLELARLLAEREEYDKVYALLSGELPGGEYTDDALWLLAESCRRLNRLDEAMRYYRRIEKNHADSSYAPAALFELASLSRQAGDYRAAADLYVAFAERYPTNRMAAAALWNAASVRLEEGDEAGAADLYHRLTKEYPQADFAADSRYRHALLNIRRRRWRDALQELEMLLHDRPGFSRAAEASYWLGVCAEKVGEPERARAAYKAVLARQRQIPVQIERDTRIRLASLLRQQQEEEAAARVLRPLLSSGSPVPADALLWLAHYEVSRADWSNALQAAERVIAITNDALVQGRARYYAGVSLAGMQAYDRAASYLNQAAAVAELPESAHAALKLGDVELARGKLPEAARAYRTAAEKASQLGLRDVQLEAWYSLARLEELNGNTDEALRLYTACGILFDDSTVVPECMYRAVLLLKKMGRDSDAGELARELEKRYPDSPWTRMLGKTTAAHE